MSPARALLAVCLALLGSVASAAPEGLAAAPLAPRSAPGGPTLFTPLAAAQTRLVADNKYDDPRMWADRYEEFVYGAIGSGLAIADWDNDGRPDVFLVSKTGRGHLFRNLGGWKFAEVTERAGLAGPTGRWAQGVAKVQGLFGGGGPALWTQGAAFADVNNDGWLDLHLCRFGVPNQLFMNQGDGTFKEEAAARGLALADASGQAAFADYDRDGWLDVYVQTNLLDARAQPEGQEDRLFRNRGDGTFEEVTGPAGIRGRSQGHAALWWDFDQDGWPDLYVANDFAVPDRLYRNQRDGTFADMLDRTVPHTPHSSMGADLGDVNNDGRTDFLVADMATTTHEKDLRGMANIRALLNNSRQPPGIAPQIMRNALYLNTGLGRMQEAAHLAGLAATDWTWSVRLEDLDCDGRLDVHVTNGMVREYHRADLLKEIMAAAEDPLASRRILQASPPLAERNLAYRNEGDLRFTETAAAWGLDQAGVSFGAAFGDFDGDGDLDLIVANYDAPPTVLRNDAPGGHRLIVALRGTRSNRFGVGATVRARTASGTQVRSLVLARGYLSTSEPVAHFGLGDDARILELSVDWPGGHRQVFTDLAADQRLTVTEPAGPPPAPHPAPVAAATLWRDVSAQFVSGWSVPEATEQPGDTRGLQPFRFTQPVAALAVAPLESGGADALLLGGTARAPLRVSTGENLPPADDGPMLVFEADGGGGPELLRTRAGTGRDTDLPVQLLRREAGRFAPVPDALPPLALAVGAAAAADFDRDGRLDVFLGARFLPGRYPLSPRSVLLRNDGGRFTDATDALAPALREDGMVTAALWSDVDADGWPDLLLAVDWGTVRYFHNDRGRGFTDRSAAAGFAAAGTGWWTALVAADFNQDGRLDYAAGNAGLNTPYQSPAVLFAGDLGGKGGLQLMEAVEEDGRLHPLRSRDELGILLPALLKRYPRNDAFARATVEEVLGPRFGTAQRFTATELRSGVFLSQPDGTHRFTPWPRVAQLAPARSLAAADFDGDGRTDLVIGQNNFTPLPATGRFDGGVGQLLRGDGRGGFTAVPPLTSGLLAPGDVRALAVLDLNADGWPDLVLSRAADSVLALQTQPPPDRRSFRVRLRGPAGNPTAIGARLTLELADGSRQMAELAAGSGALAQSAPGAFFGYPVATPPHRLTVQWPDGHRTVHTFEPPPPALLTLP